MARYDKHVSEGLVHGKVLLSSLSTVAGTTLDGIDDQSSSNDDQLTIKDTEVIINEDGDDLDFRVEGDVETHLLFVDGGSERVSIGDSVDVPAATLEVTNHATAGAYNVPLVQLNSNDTDQIAVDINAANIDADIFDITADAVTTAKVIDITADALTTGNAIYVDDDSANTGTRNTVEIIQNHVSAIAATALKVQSDGGITGVNLDKNFAGTAAATVTGLNIDLDKTAATTSDNTIYGINVDLDNTSATNGENQMVGIQVTPTLTYAADAGTSVVTGISVAATGGTNGTSVATGLEVTAQGADTNVGISVQCTDGGTDIKLISSAEDADYFSIATTAAGATTLATVDSAAAGADLTLDADGKIVVEAFAGDEAVFNEAGLDVDFRVESVDETHMIFVEGSSNRVSIGDSTDAPAATLEVTNHASAGAYNVPLVQLNSNDTDQIAIDVNAANIDADVFDITADAVTTAKVIDITADALTSGAALYIDSNSGDDTARSVATIIQNHASAPKANTLTLQQDDTTVSAADMAASLNLTGNPKIKIGTDAKNLTFHQYDGHEVARVHDNSGIGGFGYRKLIVDVEEATNLSSVSAAIPYSGAIISLVQSDASAYAITLPTATSALEGKQITGWHISVVLTGADSENVTIVRGDTGNDSIVGMVVAGDAASSGITVSSNVVTFVAGTAVAGDRVDITCTGADASNTYFVVQGMCKV